MFSWRCSSAALPWPPGAVSPQPQQEGRGVIQRDEERMPKCRLSGPTTNNGLDRLSSIVVSTERGTSTRDGREGSPGAWVAAAGTSRASSTALVTIRISASTNTCRQQAPNQVTRLQQDLFGLQPWGLATYIILTNHTLNENSLGSCYFHSLPPIHTGAPLTHQHGPLSTKNHIVIH